jgi:hypothetical protein
MDCAKCVIRIRAPIRGMAAVHARPGLAMFRVRNDIIRHITLP